MKARYLIYLLNGLMTFYSCVDDKGSYDYLQTPMVIWRGHWRRNVY